MKDKCYHCQGTGHHAKECPKRASNEEAAKIDKELEAAEVQDGVDFFNKESVGEKLDMIEGASFLEAGNSVRRTTCDRGKLYPKMCTMNHTMCVIKALDRVHTTGVKLHQHCNASTTTKMGYWCESKFWVSKNGMANLLLVPQLEKDGYQLEYQSGGGWLIHLPAGSTIHFKCMKGCAWDAIH